MLQNLTGVSPQPIDPAAQGKYIVLSEILHIAHFQAL
jgi:hypothetical protein